MAPPEWKNYAPDPTPDAEEPADATPPRREPRPSSATGRSPGRGRLLLYAGILAALLLVSVVVLVVAGMGGSGDPQTEEGFAEMLTDLEEETGSSAVFEAVVYPGYAVVGVPLKPGDEREVSYRWDGGLSEFTKGTSDEEPFDLADVDASLFEGFCQEAEALVEDPGDCYLIIRQPTDEAEQGWIDAYISNEFSQGGYISYDLEGTELARHTW